MSESDTANEWRRIDPSKKRSITTEAGKIDVSDLDGEQTEQVEELAYAAETELMGLIEGWHELLQE
jgi:hypothetical protein